MKQTWFHKQKASGNAAQGTVHFLLFLLAESWKQQNVREESVSYNSIGLKQRLAVVLANFLAVKSKRKFFWGLDFSLEWKLCRIKYIHANLPVLKVGRRSQVCRL